MRKALLPGVVSAMPMNWNRKPKPENNPSTAPFFRWSASRRPRTMRTRSAQRMSEMRPKRIASSHPGEMSSRAPFATTNVPPQMAAEAASASFQNHVGVFAGFVSMPREKPYSRPSQQ